MDSFSLILMTRVRLTLGAIIAAALPVSAAPETSNPPAHPVMASSPAVAPTIPSLAQPLALSAVRLTGGPLKHAQQLTADYLLKLEPDRMLAYFRKNAGLAPRAESYGGWDGGGKNLTGHIAGHYLSALSIMWAATGDPRFKERADWIVKELGEVQRAHGDGYLGALEGGKERFAEVAKGDIRSGGFDLNGLWSPWYTLHKVFAGLRDAYRFTGNRDALELEIGFSRWAESIVEKLDETQMQKMLNTEFGGMNEVFVDLYTDTGDKRWLALARRFEHHAVLAPLKRHQDNLSGLHGNTQVPKLLGSLANFAATGDAGEGFAAGFFWDRVVHHHSYATGGHGKDEYFGPPGQLSERIDGRTAETCNVYNMLRMTRRLFALRPDAWYSDFHERALFNHILASIDPQNGATSYMVPVGRGVHQEYQDMFESFTCCVGSGMESHALHGDGVFYESPLARAGTRQLWVTQFMPSTADWHSAGVKLQVETDFPIGDKVRVTITTTPTQEWTLSLRRPSWATEGVWAKIHSKGNTSDWPVQAAAGQFLDIQRIWQAGDSVELHLPKTLRLEPLPDNPKRAAILWGPLVLAGDLGPQEGFAAWEPGAIPVLVASGRPVAEWLKPVADKPGHFRSDGVGRDRDVDFHPFYQTHRRSYAVYWDFFTPDEWKSQAATYAAERERNRKLAEASIAFAQPGEMQPERDFNQQGEDSTACRVLGRPGRRADKWFSFDLPVDPSGPVAMVVTCYGDEWRLRTFDILVDGQKIGEQRIDKGGPTRFFDTEYPIPAEIVRGKSKVTVRFQATQGNETGGVFGIRMLRSTAPR